MITAGLRGVEFIAANTDLQALSTSLAEQKLQLGQEITKGLGAGSIPKMGRDAAEESREEITKNLKGTDMVFIAAGMGGGTGTGASSVIAEIAKSLGILTVAVVTKPFRFEGPIRMAQAEEGLDMLRSKVDALITIPNDKLLQVIERNTPMMDALKMADDVLRQGVQGIADLITIPGIINLDFADVRTIMTNAGSAMMGIGTGRGEHRAVDAAEAAISSPLLEETINGAKGVILSICGSPDLSMHEIHEAADVIYNAVDPQANIIFGSVLDERLQGEVQVTVIATGFVPGSKSTNAERFAARKLAPKNEVDETVNAQVKMSAPKIEVSSFNPEPVFDFTPGKVSDDGSADEFDIPAFIRNRE
jgi:cell division protein FtsZ